jgi:hypothetical protein
MRHNVATPCRHPILRVVMHMTQHCPPPFSPRRGMRPPFPSRTWMRPLPCCSCLVVMGTHAGKLVAVAALCCIIPFVLSSPLSRCPLCRCPLCCIASTCCPQCQGHVLGVLVFFLFFFLFRSPLTAPCIGDPLLLTDMRGVIPLFS